MVGRYMVPTTVDCIEGVGLVRRDSWRLVSEMLLSLQETATMELVHTEVLRILTLQYNLFLKFIQIQSKNSCYKGACRSQWYHTRMVDYTTFSQGIYTGHSSSWSYRVE